jgi:hypothetical protein
VRELEAQCEQRQRIGEMLLRLLTPEQTERLNGALTAVLGAKP